MSDTKHTPGPWYAHNIGLGPDGKGPYTFPLGTDPDEAAANAALIAAAPDMLAALNACARYADFTECREVLDMALAAIARAVQFTLTRIR